MKLILALAVIQTVLGSFPDGPSIVHVGELIWWDQSVSSADRISPNEDLARKTEKLLSITNKPEVETAKDELEQQIKYNFVKTLAMMLVSGPVLATERQIEVLKLMRLTLNGNLDFKPVVKKLPVLLREKEATRFVTLLDILRENENQEFYNLRQNQMNTTQNQSQLDKILEAASKISFSEIGNFLKGIPEIFEGIQTIVESVQDIF